MKPMKWIFPSLCFLAAGSLAPAQMHHSDAWVYPAQPALAAPQPHPAGTDATLSAPKEKQALQILFKSLRSHVVSAADAMPADKYGFAPTDGEFKGVRSFGQQV